MYNKLIKNVIDKNDRIGKLNYLLNLEREIIGDYGIIKLPGLDRGIICHKDGIVYNFSLSPVYKLDNRRIGIIKLNNQLYHLYKPVTVGLKSQYRWIMMGWTDIQVAEHVLISIAFGMWDGIKDLKNMEVCHKISVKSKDTIDNSINNLFVDTHNFNMLSMHVEQALRNVGYKKEISLDHETIGRYTELLNNIIQLRKQNEQYRKEYEQIMKNIK